MPRTPKENLPSPRDESAERQRSDLERRYGSIGIPAVAAAARYSGKDKTEKATVAPPATRRKNAAA